jgi:hypothetical protein
MLPAQPLVLLVPSTLARVQLVVQEQQRRQHQHQQQQCSLCLPHSSRQRQ